MIRKLATFSITNLVSFLSRLNGTLPTEIALPNIRRIDLFDNKFTGTLPVDLANVSVLQIFHAKDNMLTGTIPEKFGEIPVLSWFDVSNNMLHGTIPMSFSTTESLEDFRLGGNMLYGDVPHLLCSNAELNGGVSKLYGCDAIICPRGTFSELGYATEEKPCIPCPDGQTTIYLGSQNCLTITEDDLLMMLYEVFRGPMWTPEQSEKWGDSSVSHCEWAGIGCDDLGATTSLKIPIFAAADT